MKSTFKGKVSSIQQRVRRLKLSRVFDVGGSTGASEGKTFRYILMTLPVEKISTGKLQEMEEKTRRVRGSLHVRVATREDIPGLCDLYNAAFFQCPDQYRPVTLGDLTMIFDQFTIVIGSLYGMDAAFIILKIEEQDTTRAGLICGIAVHPRHRQNGLATAIGLEGWRHFSSQDLDILQCEVYETNEPSINFITWVGFRPEGEIVVRTPSAAALNPLERI